jgi:hypothetical protein
MCSAPVVGTFDMIGERHSRLLSCRVSTPAAA